MSNGSDADAFSFVCYVFYDVPDRYYDSVMMTNVVGEMAFTICPQTMLSLGIELDIQTNLSGVWITYTSGYNHNNLEASVFTSARGACPTASTQFTRWRSLVRATGLSTGGAIGDGEWASGTAGSMC